MLAENSKLVFPKVTPFGSPFIHAASSGAIVRPRFSVCPEYGVVGQTHQRLTQDPLAVAVAAPHLGEADIDRHDARVRYQCKKQMGPCAGAPPGGVARLRGHPLLLRPPNRQPRAGRLLTGS